MSSTAQPGFTLQPPARRKLTEAIAQQLLEQIREQNLQPGTRMPSERELMAALNVGRSTVREALNGLALMGVIEIRHGQGAFVTAPVVEPAAEDLSAALAKGVTSDLLEARLVIEIEVARLAALRRTESDLDSMRSVLAAHERAIDEGEVCATYSANFHLELAAAAHNDVLEGIVASFMPLLEALGPDLEQLPSYREWELAEHRDLYTAVLDRDANAAGDRMRQHLESMVDQHARLAAPEEGTLPAPAEVD